jgi:mycothiol synthase
MIIRPCRSEDFDAVVDIVDTAAQVDNTRRLRKETFRADYFSGTNNTPIERAFVAVQDHIVTGFIWWEQVEQTLALQGWVHPSRRGQGVGTALLCAVEDYARAKYNGDMLLAARTYADLTGTVRLFEQQEYEVAHRFNFMQTSLAGNTYQPDLPPKIRFEPFNENYLDQLVAADNAIFANHFGSHRRTVEQWRHQMIDMRPYNPALWVIAWEDDRIVGECLCNPSQQGGPKDGWVSVVGVHESWRGKGLARAVLTEGLRRLQLAGFDTAGLHVDSENVPAVKLYQRLGMDIKRVSLHLHKYLVL